MSLFAPIDKRDYSITYGKDVNGQVKKTIYPSVVKVQKVFVSIDVYILINSHL